MKLNSSATAWAKELTESDDTDTVVWVSVHYQELAGMAPMC